MKTPFLLSFRKYPARCDWGLSAHFRSRQVYVFSRTAYHTSMPTSSPARSSVPDAAGHFGPYGGIFVPETLVAALQELDAEYRRAKADPAFIREFEAYLHDYVGRPSRLYFAQRLTEKLGGAKIFLKREDLNHTGAHKINNTIGQGLLTKRMGKKRIIAETGAGQHPFPMMVGDFQACIGNETREQSMAAEGRLPDCIVACVGGGSNAAGIFYPFIEDTSVKLIGVEAGGRGSALGQHAATLSFGKPGVLHGSLSYVLQDEDGQTADVHSG